MADAEASTTTREGGGFVPKRGRPTQSQVAAIDKTILAEARALFLENGYAATSMEAVAASAGVSKGTLYARYPAKPDLFRAIAADRLAAWGAEGLGEAESVSGDIAQQLLAYGTIFLFGLRQPEVEAFDRLILSEATRFPELAEEFHQRGYDPGIDRLTQRIAQSSVATDSRTVAVAFTSALLGWFRSEVTRGKLDDAKCAAFVKRLVTVFVEGRDGW